MRGSFEARRVAAAVSEPPNAPDDDDAVPYPVDALVEAQWGGGADYYPAVVFAVGDDTVSLRYTDGDVEEGVPVNRVRPLPRRRSSAIPSYNKYSSFAISRYIYKNTITPTPSPARR